MENAIEINGLRKAYANFTLKDISFNVPSGSIVGFVGENGAGKTTTIKSVLGVIHKDAGHVSLLGQDIDKGGSGLHEEIGVVYDECSFHDWLRADQVGNILKNIYKNWDDAYYRALLAKFELAHLTGKKDIIKTYSRGMKMKLSLAAALAHRPKLLIMDEATSGLDPIVRDEILDMFLEFIQQEDHSILFSSHITSDIEKAADYLVFIHEGNIVFNEEKDLLLTNYGLVRAARHTLEQLDKAHVIGIRESEFGAEALVNNRPELRPDETMVVEKATIDDIMLYTIRGKTA